MFTMGFRGFYGETRDSASVAPKSAPNSDDVKRRATGRGTKRAQELMVGFAPLHPPYALGWKEEHGEARDKGMALCEGAF